MHILVINDDGPPEPSHSPYVHSLVRTLRTAGHVVSVCLPHVQRSWIGKAHFIGERVTPSYYRPGSGKYGEGGVTSEFPSEAASLESSGGGSVGTTDGMTASTSSPSSKTTDEWVLVDGTPASCAQLGLHHLFRHRGPVDLVVSGPNFGRNTSTLYALSSGTLGGALEAAACRVKAIGLSFAYDRPRHDDPDVIAAASRHSVRVIQHLWERWGEGVDLYSVNVPVRPDVESEKVVITYMLQNRWDPGESCFRAVDAPGSAEGNVVEEEKDKAFEDKVARETQETEVEREAESGYRHRYYEWAPSHASVRRSVAESPDGADGKALVHGWTSVTPLKAALWEVAAHPMGEMKLSSSFSLEAIATPKMLAHIAYDDVYVQPLILSALATQLSSQDYALVSEPLPNSAIDALSCPYLHIASYESLSHECLLYQPTKYFANAYTIRKALIRKHHLASTVAAWRSKRRDDILGEHLPLTLSFELDYAEFLDEALVEAYELHEAWERNADKSPSEREWWILKPGMSDRGQGIRLFSSEGELREIFEQWEAANPEQDSDDEAEIEALDTAPLDSAGLMASQLRHFIVQPYLSPYLFPASASHPATKFHLRSYVLAIGALRVFVHNEPLALFASKPYIPPGSSSDTSPPVGGDQTRKQEIDMRPHLTNTCLQTDPASKVHLNGIAQQTNTHHGPVALLSHLSLPSEIGTSLFSTICACTASLFRAACAMPTQFQPLPNAFELFGVDWLVDKRGKPWVLEVNAFPDFGQSGDVGMRVVEDVWRGALARVLKERGLLKEDSIDKEGMGFVTVLDEDLGRNRRRDDIE